MNNAESLPPESETLLTRKDLSKRHRVSVETCKRRERAGILHPLKLGRGVRYRLSDIIALEQAARV